MAVSQTRVRLFQLFQLAQLDLDVGWKRSGSGITSRSLLAIGLAVLLVRFYKSLFGLCVALLGSSLGGLFILFGGFLGGGGGLGLGFLFV